MIIKSEQPNCKVCNKPLENWFLFQEKFVCSGCLSEKISNSIINNIRKAFYKN